MGNDERRLQEAERKLEEYLYRLQALEIRVVDLEQQLRQKQGG